MKSLALCIAVVLVLVSSACSHQQPQWETESRFIRELSLDDMIARMNVPQLKHSSTSVGGGSSAAADVARRARDFQFVSRIEDADEARFDEEDFLRGLNDEINRSAAEAGVHVVGSGQSGDAYTFEYTQGEHDGTLTLIGARTDGGEYKLWCVVREITRHNSGS